MRSSFLFSDRLYLTKIAGLCKELFFSTKKYKKIKKRAVFKGNFFKINSLFYSLNDPVGIFFKDGWG